MSVLAAWLDQILNGLTIGMVYVLLAAGLSIIFGVMDVINFAHGELFALGAYFAVSVVAVEMGGFWLALLVAPLLVAAVGAGVERLTIRPLYGRNPLYHILLTFGLVLIFKDVVEAIWGTQSQGSLDVGALAGQVTVFGYTNSAYSYFVIAAGAVVASGAWYVLNRTRFGLVVRAGSMDREMVRHLGIDIDRYYTLVFAFGAFLAAVGGVVLAGRRSVEPALGDQVIIPAFVIVVLGGLGSFRGAVIAGLGVGLIQTLARWQVPGLEGLVVFLLMIGVLLVRPQGLFGSATHEPADEAKLLTGAQGGVLDSVLRTRLSYALVGLLLLAPLGIGVVYTAYEVNTLLVTVLIWALFALSLDFVLGYAGLVSLGHVLFYGVGAYATVLVTLHLVPSVFVALAVGMALSALVAWAVGHLSIRVAGVYFAMITLAFAELAHSLVVKLPWAGSSDGLFGFDPVYGLLGGPEVGDVELLGEIHLFYYFVVALVVGSYLVARRLIRAPFGSVLQAIRESEQRAEFLGYDVVAYKRRAFVVSGALAGLAGGLAAIHVGGVDPSFLGWLKSGEVIVMTLLGGMGTLYGPMLGAGAFFGVKEVLLSVGIEQWQGVLGLVFVCFVIFVPKGLVSLPTIVQTRLRTHSERGGETAPLADGEVDD